MNRHLLHGQLSHVHSDELLHGNHIVIQTRPFLSTVNYNYIDRREALEKKPFCIPIPAGL
jgi:hypothetical protein